MTFLKNLRLRIVLIAGVTLAVVAAIGISVANANVGSTSTRWVTAVAASGDVTQNYLTTGTISRKNTITASFAATGTVNKISVAVGDAVSAGQTLATINTRALKLAVLEAETSVARAELTLYNAKHPSSTSTTSTTKASTSSKTAGVTVTFDLAALNAAVKRVTDANTAEATACDPILAWANEEATSTDSASASASPTATADASTGDPTSDELKACATARVEVEAAGQNLTTVTAAINKAAGASSGGSKSGSGSSSSTKVSASAVASAKAALLEANQSLQSAEDDLDDATLVAPVSGTVGTITLSKGASSSSGSITIVGQGSAVVTVELPLSTRTALAVGATAKVTPAGSLTALEGKVTNISALETSGTSGSTTTYSTTISVSDPDELLASGAKASVAIPVKSVTSVVTVPVSAVTPTGTGTATVQVLATGSTTPSTVSVKTGAVGGGYVEITEGLSAGQVVVLADKTADLPTNATRSNRSSSSSSSSKSSSSSTGSSSSKSSSSSSAAPQPSATR